MSLDGLVKGTASPVPHRASGGKGLQPLRYAFLPGSSMPSKLMQTRWILALFTISSALITTAHASQRLATVPFVGCKADGQLGPVTAPKGQPKSLAIPQSAAAHLAWYQTAEDGGNLGVLAPRGWHCFGTYGSNGENLYIGPSPISTIAFFSETKWKGLTGPGIQLTVEYGGTSGRFGVAETIVQLFPRHMQFVTDLVATEKQVGGYVPDYHKKPFPSDTLFYKSNELVEFTTPARAIGIGTDESWLKPAADPISGMMYLGGITKRGEDVFLVQLFVRLSPSQGALLPVIITEAEPKAESRPR